MGLSRRAKRANAMIKPMMLNKLIKLWGYVGLITLLQSFAFAAEQVEVLGVSSGKAIVRVDGKQRLLTIGQATPEGVRLLSATADAAVLEVNGKQNSYPLGAHTGIAFEGPREATLRILRNSSGMYAITGAINGQLVEFLVDTGATLVALNSQLAKKLGINYRVTGQLANVSTASGMASAYRVKLNSVKAGAIEVKNVDAVIIEGAHPNIALMGMSFLNQITMLNDAGVLVLTQRR